MYMVPPFLFAGRTHAPDEPKATPPGDLATLAAPHETVASIAMWSV